MTYNYLSILNKMIQWFEKNHYKSYDLCDISSQKYFLNIKYKWNKKKYGKYVIHSHDLLIKYFSHLLRKSYKIEKKSYVQARALIARGYLKLYKTGYKDYLNRAEEIFDWILSKRTSGFKYYCWGQPYDWFSGKVIPAHTPRTTVTSQMGHAFLDLYEVTRQESQLETAKNIAFFFIHEMKRSYDKKDKLCFSYTTIDNHKTHNTNMMAASFFTRLGVLTNEKEFLDVAEKLNAFSMDEQNNDGSWFYYLYDDGRPSKIDNYHTGYILESLSIQKRYLKEDFNYQKEFEKGIKYYVENLFEDNIIPKLTNNKIYPIDIQSCAQAILTYSSIHEAIERYGDRAIAILNFTIENFYDHQGYFYYRVYRSNKVDKTPYIRWGDSWMFYAISNMLEQKLIRNDSED